jgi:copper resistance protein D
MRFLYQLSVSIHLLAAIVWLGGMLFLAMVGAPLIRTLEQPALRQRLFRDIGVRFRTVGWAAIAVLVVTGITNLWARGVLGLLATPSFWSTDFGRNLTWKLAAVTTMLTISAIHDFIEGPRASRLDPRSEEALAHRRRSAMLARINALVGVLLVFVAVRLVR